jgi:hypothetical protein
MLHSNAAGDAGTPEGRERNELTFAGPEIQKARSCVTTRAITEKRFKDDTATLKRDLTVC